MLDRVNAIPAFEANVGRRQRSNQGRALVPCDQAAVRLHQGALPGPGQEHCADRHAVRAIESVDGAAVFDRGPGMSASAPPESGFARPVRSLRSTANGRQVCSIEVFGGIVIALFIQSNAPRAFCKPSLDEALGQRCGNPIEVDDESGGRRNSCGVFFRSAPHQAVGTHKQPVHRGSCCPPP